MPNAPFIILSLVSSKLTNLHPFFPASTTSYFPLAVAISKMMSVPVEVESTKVPLSVSKA